MKLKSYIMFAMVACVFLLAACSETEGQKEEGASKEEEKKQSETKTITHLKGETEIPENVDKVVALRPSYFDHMLTIDEKPAGVTAQPQYGGDYIPYLSDQLEGAEIVGSAAEVNLEKILEINPDLILVDDYTASQVYEDLEKIAPTIVLGAESEEDRNDPEFWKQDLMKIAKIFDKEALAEEKIAELEEKVAKAQEEVSKLENKKLAFLRIREKVIQIYPETTHPMVDFLYTDLGFEPSDLTDPKERGDLSMEVIPEMNADHIFLQVDSSGGPENYSSIQESSLWKDLDAVENGNVLKTDFWIYKAWGAIGRGQMVDEAMEYINK
ncbi:ABC transporter substrate-binding protein [Pontibacillus salipaludis]|uniref:Ferrichrome ABC transporter substrate-binding protein n=1 Tax=Pontibacillus salipaludis TaxID=1697394 RepID=A0ABQ1PZW8_9BACI|nr:ABC transporter substrate-binding protein [Pontibacillus salipaludis]GGD08678.1 ferrichrome ABC transporter substrate-binding protein [Pontibacillus salipaludis]